MRWYSAWLETEFRVHHSPGVARAWLRIEPTGDWYMVTDPGGYDLPERDGPFVVTHVARGPEHDEDPQLLPHRAALAAWLRERTTCRIPTDNRF